MPPLLLTRQYRMHPLLAEFPSKRFYDGKLRSIPTPEERERPASFPWPHASNPVAFVRIDGPRPLERRTRAVDDSPVAEVGNVVPGSRGSIENPTEASAVVTVIQGLIEGGTMASDIGVVTPYSAQALLITKLLSSTTLDTAVEVSSVDGYQGREKEIILFSAVRSNDEGSVGFLKDWRRLNVAITRARRGLILFGDDGTLRTGCPNWAAYLDWLRRNGALVTRSSHG